MKLATQKIAGMSPPDYAALWGSTFDNRGVMFYGFASEWHSASREWLETFAREIMGQIEEIIDDKINYDPEDASDLARLLAVVLAMPGRD